MRAIDTDQTNAQNTTNTRSQQERFNVDVAGIALDGISDDFVHQYPHLNLLVGTERLQILCGQVQDTVNKA